MGEHKDAPKITKTCDRCDNTLIRDMTLKDYFPVELDGWHRVRGYMLCPQCVLHYQVIFNKFMKKEL